MHLFTELRFLLRTTNVWAVGFSSIFIHLIRHRCFDSHVNNSNYGCQRLFDVPLIALHDFLTSLGREGHQQLMHVNSDINLIFRQYKQLRKPDELLLLALTMVLQEKWSQIMIRRLRMSISNERLLSTNILSASSSALHRNSTRTSLDIGQLFILK
jgi:hypothetical protein